jgi:hypothetical protein
MAIVVIASVVVAVISTVTTAPVVVIATDVVSIVCSSGRSPAPFPPTVSWRRRR